MEHLLRRYLRTKADLEEPEIVLERLSRAEALDLAGDLASGGATPSAPRSPSPATSGAAPISPSLPRPVPKAPSSAPPAEEIARLAREGTSDEILALPDLSTLAAVAEKCVRCPLHEARTHVVFGEGDPTASVVCVGEAPGAVEDETGRPFVGRAGQLLDRLLLAVGFPRESVYICNVLKSRPPGNRDPLPDEIEACSPFMLRQLALIEPRIVVAFGAFAARTLLDTKKSLGSLRGQFHSFAGFPVIVTYHPAALLRNPKWTRATWEDLQRVRRVVDGLEEPVRVPGRNEATDRPAAPGAGDGPSESEQGGLFG